MTDRFVFCLGGMQHHRRACELMREGLAKHGIALAETTRGCLVDAPVAIMWGPHFPDVRAHQERIGGQYIVLTAAYFGGRWAMTAMGWDGINRDANYCNAGVEPKRWLKTGPTYADWKEGGDYVLILGQYPGHPPVEGRDIQAEYTIIAETLREYGVPVRYRPHPAGGAASPPDADVLDGTLEHALSGASCVVTINSNAATDAVIAGVPAVTLDRGAMAWDVSGHEVADAIVPVKPDRYRWAVELAYCQWTDQEIVDGVAWEHLSRGYHP